MALLTFEAGAISGGRCGAPFHWVCVASRHENLFRLVFRDPVRTAAWLRTVLPRPLACGIDWGSLRPAPEKLVRETLRLCEFDLVFFARFRGGCPLWLLIEHKSSPDRVADQVGRYVFELRRRAPEPGARTPVPVLAVVAYHGGGALPFEPAAPALFDETRAEPEELVAALEPRLPIFAADLTARREEEVLESTLDPAAKAALLCLGYLGRMDAAGVIAALRRWRELLVAVDRQDAAGSGDRVLRGVQWYCLSCTEVDAEALRDAFESLLNRPDDYIMSTAERIRREGHQLGIAEGEARGMAAALLTLIRRRFGPPADAVETRVRAASTAQLERWLDRVLGVADIEELFRDD